MVRKSLGLGGFLTFLIVGTCAIEFAKNGHVNFVSALNIKNVLTMVGLYGILSLGQSFVIITGGIDLSIGSLCALIAVSTAVLMDRGNGLSPAIVLPAMLALSALIGVGHGLLVAKARIQPFVVTLCGLFFYRGIARLVAQDTSQGFGSAYGHLKWFGRGTLLDLVGGAKDASGMSWWETVLDCSPGPFLVLLVLAAIVAAYLHASAQGRHLFALGANEEGARFSGIRTDRLKITAYVLCSLLSGFGGILLAFKVNSLQASSFGNFHELYAIAGAVLGGCSLRGGSGNVLAILFGAAILRVLYNMVNILGIPSQLVYAVIGGAILIGVCVDEFFTRRAAVRAARG
ncbi:MAG: ABC transporter permease [Candidatus Hydrogenedentes bacterium]|nr:ABC transporter permease [Candidatus Hydrogenedentota bacterium]